MRGKIITAAIFIALCAGGCSSQKDTAIEYGTEVKLEDYFNLKEGEKISANITIDSKFIGDYDVKATITGKDNVKREENKKLTVKDSNQAEIILLQASNTTYDIPFQAKFNPVGNIDKIADNVDGEYKEIDIVSKDEYEKTLQTVKDVKEKTQKMVFANNEEFEKYKKNRSRSGYTLLTSDVNTEKEGTYTIRISTIDKSFNITEKSYQVKVMKKGEKVEDAKLAAGVDGTKMGGALAYTINNKTAKKENKKVDKTLPATQEQNQQKFESNIVSKDSINAQGSPVLQAALNYVGAHMMCDDLATMALVDGGYLTGTPERIFHYNGYYSIGVYQFPCLGTYISEAQVVPGDLILYDDGGYGSMHVAVYAGNGQAVHGGFMGENVVVSTVYLGSGPRYFRVQPMTWSDVSYKIYGYYTDENGNMIWPDEENGTTSSGSSDIFNNDPNPWIGNDDSDTTYTYTSTLTLNDTSITLSSSTPIDDNAVFAQLELYESGQIGMEELKANFSAMGYTVIG